MELTDRMIAVVQVRLMAYTVRHGWDGSETVARLERIEMYLIERYLRDGEPG